MNCLYFTILYAAGIINELGPESISAISCILNLPLDDFRKSDSSSSTKTHLGLVFGLTGAGVVVLVIILGLYYLWDRKWRKKSKPDLDDEDQEDYIGVHSHDQEISKRYLVYDYMPNGNLDDQQGQSHLRTTRVAGTHKYLAPEYALYGHGAPEREERHFTSLCVNAHGLGLVAHEGGESGGCLGCLVVERRRWFDK
ncbi:hypothetical protein Acr_06g0014320 [Actinidia rufa]|uniref:Uncharacterized protein n=1 Tax=Actinidia rufa TaxID=165716 RepID=A0A7J0ET20_9ERIC|nr:hypothetical protein Acr_06g0014320 [Actinidia rufa]